MSKHNSIHCQKSSIRRQMKELKKALSGGEKSTKSNSIFQQLEAKSYFQNANIIAAYCAMPDEVQTMDFILKWHTKKRYCSQL
jgi:5-formyltetrahydrofolate cyclo-ligase